VDELTALGLPVVPSDANFVAFGVAAAGGSGREHRGDAKAVWRALLDRGVLVRDVGLPGMLRVTAGTPEETGAFLNALKEIL